MTHAEARKVFLTTNTDPLLTALINIKTKVERSAPTATHALVVNVSRCEVFPDKTGDPRRIVLEVEVNPS